MPGGHTKNRFAGTEKTAKDIGRENAFEASPVDRVETRLAFHGAGVIDQGSERAELAGGGLKQAHDFCLVAHVGLDRDRSAPILADGGHNLFSGWLVPNIVDAHVESASCGQEGGYGSDAAAGAGDDQDAGAIGHGGWVHTLQSSGRQCSIAFLISPAESFSFNAFAASTGSSASDAKRNATSCDSVNSAMRGRSDGASKVARRNLSSSPITRSWTLRGYMRSLKMASIAAATRTTSQAE